MRDLTDHELDTLRNGHCPFCGGIKFMEGPEGGLSKNWYCATKGCGAGVNLMMGGNLGGQLIQPPGSTAVEEVRQMPWAYYWPILFVCMGVAFYFGRRRGR